MAKMQACCTILSRDCPVFLPHFVHLVPPGEAQTPALFWHPLQRPAHLHLARAANRQGNYPRQKRTLGSFLFMGIAVGLVISGEYFAGATGWSQAGDLGLYGLWRWRLPPCTGAFIFSFTELTTAIPHAAAPSLTPTAHFRPTGGFIAGFATLIEFVFAPPGELPWRSAPGS